MQFTRGHSACNVRIGQFKYPKARTDFGGESRHNPTCMACLLGVGPGSMQLFERRMTGQNLQNARQRLFRWVLFFHQGVAPGQP